MFDEINFDDLPKFDQYDDDFFLQIEANLSDESKIYLWEPKVQCQQLEYSDQLMHISDDSEKESAENLEVNDICLFVLLISIHTRQI